MKPQNILAIETATARGSIALLQGDRLLQTVCIGDQLEHSKTLIPRIQELLQSHSIRPSDLDLIAVSKGPGSFTGIRVGIACAKGLALGLGIPVVGIPTMEVLLAGFLREFFCQEDSHVPQRIALLIDARKGEFFLQFWRPAKGSKKIRWIATSPQVIPEKDVASKIVTRQSRTIVVSPHLSKVMALLPDVDGKKITGDSKDRFPDAQDLAYLGAAKYKHQKSGDAVLTAFYLRKTDAEILFKNKPRSVFKWERAVHANLS